MPSPAEHLAASRSTHGGSARWLDAHVRTIMRAGVISVPSDASIGQVQRALVAHNVHAVLVVDAQTGDTVGWATARGVLEHMLADTALTPAYAAVTEPAEFVEPAASAEDALRRMLATGCQRLLVRRHAASPPEGVVSEMDLVALATPR
jgi:CBS domain-containing protein